MCNELTINRKRVNHPTYRNRVQSYIIKEDFNSIFNCVKQKPNSLAFKVLIENNKLDYLIELKDRGYMFTNSNATHALKHNKIEILKWAICHGAYPDMVKVCEQANLSNNFEIVEFMIDNKAFKIPRSFAQKAYRYEWYNVVEWLKTKGCNLSRKHKKCIDEQKRFCDTHIHSSKRRRINNNADLTKKNMNVLRKKLIDDEDDSMDEKEEVMFNTIDPKLLPDIVLTDNNSNNPIVLTDNNSNNSNNPIVLTNNNSNNPIVLTDNNSNNSIVLTNTNSKQNSSTDSEIDSNPNNPVTLTNINVMTNLTTNITVAHINIVTNQNSEYIPLTLPSIFNPIPSKTVFVPNNITAIPQNYSTRNQNNLDELETFKPNQIRHVFYFNINNEGENEILGNDVSGNEVQKDQYTMNYTSEFNTVLPLRQDFNIESLLNPNWV